MSSQNPGRESPPAEKQSDSQKNAPSSGQGVSDKPNTAESAKDQLKVSFETKPLFDIESPPEANSRPIGTWIQPKGCDGGPFGGAV